MAIIFVLIKKLKACKIRLFCCCCWFKIWYKFIGKTTWRCCKPQYKASCFTYGQSIGSKYPVDMKDMKEHNHTPDLQKEHILEKRRKIKTQASLCDEAPRKIISKCVDDVQAINRAKAKVRPVFPPKPSVFVTSSCQSFWSMLSVAREPKMGPRWTERHYCCMIHE